MNAGKEAKRKLNYAVMTVCIIIYAVCLYRIVGALV